MANNIGIKARVHDFAALMKAAEFAAGKVAVVISQRDTFFNSDTGRLQLREFTDGSGELISYLRENSLEPVPSDYLIYKTYDPDVLKNTLAMTLGFVVSSVKLGICTSWDVLESTWTMSMIWVTSWNWRSSLNLVKIQMLVTKRRGI